MELLGVQGRRGPRVWLRGTRHKGTRSHGCFCRLFCEGERQLRRAESLCRCPQQNRTGSERTVRLHAVSGPSQALTSVCTGYRAPPEQETPHAGQRKAPPKHKRTCKASPSSRLRSPLVSLHPPHLLQDPFGNEHLSELPQPPALPKPGAPTRPTHVVLLPPP